MRKREKTTPQDNKYSLAVAVASPKDQKDVLGIRSSDTEHQVLFHKVLSPPCLRYWWGKCVVSELKHRSSDQVSVSSTHEIVSRSFTFLICPVVMLTARAASLATKLRCEFCSW